MNKYQENIVSSVNQNEVDEFLFPNKDSKLRILFVGNSITKHAIMPSIGWTRDCGMAASDIDHDYVHVMVKMIKEKYDPNVSYAMLQVANYERQFMQITPDELYPEKMAQSFGADIILFFFGANVPKTYDPMPDEEKPKRFAQAYEDLRTHLKTENNTIFHSMGFYIRPVLEKEKLEVIEKYGDTYIDISDIRERDDTHGMFNHPGDLGMQVLAERFFSVLEPKIKEICEG